MENKVKFWLARDKSGELFLSSERPNKEKDIWKLEGNYVCMELSFRKFPSIKWKDDEPTEAYITLAEPQEQQTPKQEIDWEQRRYEIAKEIMPVIYKRFADREMKYGQIVKKEYAVDYAIEIVDMLIKKLKDKSE